MNDSEFLRQQRAAVERMREMNARAANYADVKHKMPPVPSFVNLPENRRNNTPPPPSKTPIAAEKKQTAPMRQSQPKTEQSGLQIPFLDSIIKDSDTTLIIGLLLILMSENSDKMLLFALVYILL